MQKKRRVRFDPELGVEAYCLGGTVETFPLHFHDYYVAGMIESGRRRMLGSGSCVLEPGDMIPVSYTHLRTSKSCRGRLQKPLSAGVSPQKQNKTPGRTGGLSALFAFSGEAQRLLSSHPE